jgi:hypothetical protein
VPGVGKILGRGTTQNVHPHHWWCLIHRQPLAKLLDESGLVARANLKALSAVEQNQAGTVLNIGSGTGVSVLQIVEAVSKQIGKPIKYHPRPDRSGDPAYTVSDISKAHSFLGWTPVASSLTNIVATVVSSCKVKTETLVTYPLQLLVGSKDVINCQTRGRKIHPKASVAGVSNGRYGCDGHAHRTRRLWFWLPAP